MFGQVEGKQPVRSVTTGPAAMAFDLAQEKLEAGLQVHLLGPPEVTWTGHSLPIPRRQTRSLLYRLAAQLEPLSRAIANSTLAAAATTKRIEL